MDVNRRTCLRTAAASLVTLPGLATAGGSADSQDDAEFDVAVWGTDHVLESGPDSRPLVARQLRSSLKTLVAATGVATVSVSTRDDPIPETEIEDSTDWGQVLDERDDTATDSNLLLAENAPAEASATGCHLTGACVEQSSADAAVIGASSHLTDLVTGDRASHIDGTPTDPDSDGRYEDVNGDGSVNVGDAQAIFARATAFPAADREMYDVNEDGEVNVGDAQRLFNTDDGRGVAGVAPARYAPRTAATRTLQNCIHEVGHNLGLQHDMGRARVETVGGEEVIAVTPMLGGYYRGEDGPDPGDETRDGYVLPEREGRPLVVDYRFSAGVREHAGEWLFDE